MKSYIYIAITLGLIALVSAIIFFSKFTEINKQAPAPGNMQMEDLSNSMESIKDSDNAGVSTFSKLSVSGKDMKCSFSTDGLSDDDYSSNGLVYLNSDAMIRAEGVVILDNQELLFNFIDDGQQYYSWGNSVGGDYAITEGRFANADASLAGFDPNRPIEYICEDTSFSNNSDIFIPPATIEFTSYGDNSSVNNLDDVFPDYNYPDN